MPIDPSVLQRLLDQYAPLANSKTPILDTLKRLTSPAPKKPAIRTITADPAQVLASPVVPPVDVPSFQRAQAPEFYVPPAPKRPSPDELATQKSIERNTLKPWRMPAQVSPPLPRIGQVDIPSLSDLQKSVVPAISAMGAPIVSAGRVARGAFSPDVAGEGATEEETLPQREREAFMGGVVQGGSLGYATPKQIVGAPDLSPEVQSAREAGALLGSSATNAVLGYGSALATRGLLKAAGVVGGRLVNEVAPAIAGRGPIADALSRALYGARRVVGTATQGGLEGVVYGGAEGALRKQEEGESRLTSGVKGAFEPTNILMGAVLEPVMGGVKVDTPAPVRPTPKSARSNPLEQPRVREAQNIAGARNAENAGMDTSQISEARELRDMRIIDPAPGTGPLTVQRGSFGNIEDARQMLRDVYTAEGQQAGIIETANGYRVVTRNNKANEQLQLAGEPQERPMYVQREVNQAPPPAPIVKTKNVIQEDIGKIDKEEVIKDMEKQGFKMGVGEEGGEGFVREEFLRRGEILDEKLGEIGTTAEDVLALDSSLDGKILANLRKDAKITAYTKQQKREIDALSPEDLLLFSEKDTISSAMRDAAMGKLRKTGEAAELKALQREQGKLTEAQVRAFQKQYADRTKTFDGDTNTEVGLLPARPVEEPPTATKPMSEQQRKEIADAFDRAIPDSELLTELNPASIQRVAFQLRRLENMDIIPKGTADATVKYMLQRKVSGAVLKKDIFAGKTLTKSSRSFQDPPTDSVTMIKDNRGFVALHELTHSASKNELENEIGRFFGNIEKRVNTRKKWARKYLENLGAGGHSLYGAGLGDGMAEKELVAVIEQTLFTKAQEGKVDPFNVEPALRAAIPEDAPPEVIAFFEETLIPEMTNVWENTSVNQDKGKFSKYSERKHQRLAPPKESGKELTPMEGDDGGKQEILGAREWDDWANKAIFDILPEKPASPRPVNSEQMNNLIERIVQRDRALDDEFNLGVDEELIQKHAKERVEELIHKGYMTPYGDAVVGGKAPMDAEFSEGEAMVRAVTKQMEEQGMGPSKESPDSIMRKELDDAARVGEQKAIEGATTMDDMFTIWDRNMPESYREQLGYKWSELQNAERGRKGASREGDQWYERSTFPNWMPEDLKRRTHIDAFFEKLGRTKIKPGSPAHRILESLFDPAPVPSFFVEGGAVPTKKGAQMKGFKRSGPRATIAEMKADPYAEKLEKALGGPAPKLTMEKIEELKAEGVARYENDPEALKEFISEELPEVAKILRDVPFLQARSLGVRSMKGLSRKEVEKILVSQGAFRRQAGQTLNVAKADTQPAAIRATETLSRMEDLQAEIVDLDAKLKEGMNPDQYFSKKNELKQKIANLTKEYTNAVDELVQERTALAEKGKVSKQTVRQMKIHMATDKIMSYVRGNILSAIGARLRDVVTTKLNLEVFGRMDILGAQLSRAVRKRKELGGVRDTLDFILGPWKTAKEQGVGSILSKKVGKDVRSLARPKSQAGEMLNILSGKKDGLDTAYFKTRDEKLERGLNTIVRDGLDEQDAVDAIRKRGYMVGWDENTSSYVVLKPQRVMDWAMRAAALPETLISSKVQALSVHQIAEELASEIARASAKEQGKTFVLRENVDTIRESLIKEYYDAPQAFAKKYPMAVQFVKDQVDYYTFKQELSPEIIANFWKKLTHREFDIWENGEEPYWVDFAGVGGELANGLAQMIQPFFKIGVNIAKQGITRTAPLGSAWKALTARIPSIASGASDDKRAFSLVQKSGSFGKMLTGIAVSGLAMKTVMNGTEENPYYEFTGPYPTDQRKQQEWAAMKKKEYSFILKFGSENPDDWWQLDFRTFGQLNTPLKTWAAIRDSAENLPENSTMIDRAVKSMFEIGSNIATDAATFQFADKFLTAASRGDTDALISTVISQAITEGVPFSGFMKEISRATDVFERDVTSGSTEEKTKNILKGMFGFIPSERLQNLGGPARRKRTVSGEELRKYTDDEKWLTRVFMPFITGGIVQPMSDAKRAHRLLQDGLTVAPVKPTISAPLEGMKYRLSKDQEADLADALKIATGNAVEIFYRNMEKGTLPFSPSLVQVYKDAGITDVTIDDLDAIYRQKILDTMVSDFRSAASIQWRMDHESELTPYLSQ